MAMHVLVVLAFLAVATATRVDSNIQRSPLVGSDVTDLVKDRGDLRCCCDNNGQVCHIMYYADMRQYFWRAPKCRDFKFDSDHGTLHHFTSTGGACYVSQDEAANLVERLGSDPEYCRHIEHDQELGALVTRAPLGKTVNVSCAQGWTAAAAVTCKFESPISLQPWITARS